jgi:hypothetical protein
MVLIKIGAPSRSTGRTCGVCVGDADGEICFAVGDGVGFVVGDAIFFLGFDVGVAFALGVGFLLAPKASVAPVKSKPSKPTMRERRFTYPPSFNRIRKGGGP